MRAHLHSGNRSRVARPAYGEEDKDAEEDAEDEDADVDNEEEEEDEDAGKPIMVQCLLCRLRTTCTALVTQPLSERFGIAAESTQAMRGSTDAHRSLREKQMKRVRKANLLDRTAVKIVGGENQESEDSC